MMSEGTVIIRQKQTHSPKAISTLERTLQAATSSWIVTESCCRLKFDFRLQKQIQLINFVKMKECIFVGAKGRS